MSQLSRVNSVQRLTKPVAQNEHNETSLAIASLNATIKQLRAEGIEYEVDASIDGLRVLIPGLTLADTGNGKRRIVKVDESTEMTNQAAQP